MPRYFMRSGHIEGVEELPELPDAEAIEKCRQMFEERGSSSQYDGFEFWQLSRKVIQHPPVEQRPVPEVKQREP